MWSCCQRPFALCQDPVQKRQFFTDLRATFSFLLATLKTETFIQTVVLSWPSTDSWQTTKKQPHTDLVIVASSHTYSDLCPSINECRWGSDVVSMSCCVSGCLLLWLGTNTHTHTFKRALCAQFQQDFIFAANHWLFPLSASCLPQVQCEKKPSLWRHQGRKHHKNNRGIGCAPKRNKPHSSQSQRRWFWGVSVLCYININLLPEQLELARPF